MKTKKIGFGILLMLLVLAFAPIGVQAKWVPSDNELRQAVRDEMLDNHPELGGLLDITIWDVELANFLNRTSFKLRASWVIENEKYELTWFGTVFWTRWSSHIYVTELYFNYDVTIIADDIGPGFISDPGVYHVDGGSFYCFTSQAAVSEEPDDYYFAFLKWKIDDGYSVRYEYDAVCSGYAYTDTTITAIFETRYMSHCSIYYEDDLNGGYLWRDDHVVLAISVKGASAVTVTVISGYGNFQRTYNTRVRSLNIYFSALRFAGDYELIVTATNGLPYTPSYILAGREGIMD